MNTKKYGISAVEYNVTDSTNERAKLYAKDGWNGEPVLFIADEQTNGRGRYSRKFYSKKGAGVYLSLLFRPNTDVIGATAVVALSAISMIKAIREQVSADVKIKWVNDLVLGERKLGGILIEGSVNPASKSYDYLIAGIGVNLYSTELDEEIKDIATDLESETGIKIDKTILTKSFLAHFLAGIGKADSDELFEEYKSRLITPGKAVTIKTVTEEYDAKATHLNRDYSLSVITNRGEEKRIYTGEASISHGK